MIRGGGVDGVYTEGGEEDRRKVEIVVAAYFFPLAVGISVCIV